MNAGTSLFTELKRRNVLRAAAFYAASAWLLVQVATQVLPFFHIAEWVVRWVVIAAATGFPFAMLFSWFYEITADGVKFESGIARDASITRTTGKKLDRWIIAVLALAVVLLLTDRFVLRGNAAAAIDKSIAVLPLANSTGDPANEYFSDGISEELISSLSRLSQLKVIGRTSSFQFKNRTEDSRAIGEKLGVAYLLEGSVRKSAERVRIAVELVQAIDGATVWSSTYDRDLRDIFAVQSEIATAVAGQLKIALLGNNAGAAAALSQAAPSNQNLDAYTAFLQGNFYAHRYSAEDGRRAVASYEEAARLDPDYAPAYAALAFTAALTTETFASNSEQKAAALAKARAAADKATRLAPDLAEAHAARGYLLNFDSFDLPGAFAEYQRAYELAPQDAANLNALSFYHATRGEFDRALDFGRRAVAVDPLLSVARGDLAFELIASGAYDEAEAILHKTIELQPQSGKTHQYLSTIAILRGDAARALDEARQEPDPFWHSYGIALAEAFAGHHAEADAALRTLIESSPEEGASQIAMVYGLRQQPDEMFRWLEHARQAHDPGVYTLYMVPFLSRYRDDPRFAALCRELGLPLPADRARHP